ncbi:MAG: Gfo/Idh/MocA family oxidoreductase [Thermomicrobiales bacterium]|nr:Gfo/Idh/MocA family oxidoreductase [Thermomicrobiales bacterium]MCO5229458.1 Gfo/Idh/MocA family oxidoreductase [Thermomicrobiales bacterium]
MTFKLIHVGLGGWGMDWERTALATIADRVTVTGIVEAWQPNLERAQEVLGYTNAQSFTNLTDALTSVEADAVLITSPPATHMSLAVEAMRAGKHVLSEKPMASSIAEAREAIQVSRETGMHLQISQNYRYYPALIKAVELLRDGVLGGLARVNVDFRQWVHDAPAGENPYYDLDHPLLSDMAIHHWDMMRMILGCEAESIYVQRSDPSWSNYRDVASATAIVTFTNGVVVSYRGSWMSSDTPTFWAGEWKMECEDGLISMTSRQGGPFGTQGDAVSIRTRSGVMQPQPLPHLPVWGRSAGVLDLQRWIETGEPSQNAAERNLGSLAIVEAAIASAASGQVEPVRIPRD